MMYEWNKVINFDILAAYNSLIAHNTCEEKIRIRIATANEAFIRKKLESIILQITKYIESWKWYKKLNYRRDNARCGCMSPQPKSA